MKYSSKTKFDKPLLIVTFILLVFGLIMILSASSMASYMRYKTSIYHYVIRQGIFVIGGLILYILAVYFPTKLYKRTSLCTMILFILLLIGLFFFGVTIGGSKSWYDLKITNFQPSEVGKIIVILFLANYYEKHHNELDDIIKIIKPLLFVFTAFVCIAMQPDFGTASVIAGISVFIFYSLSVKKNTRKPINRLLMASMVLFVLVLVLTKGSFLPDYQLKRFNFLNPCERYTEKSGYQLCNSLIALKNGGLMGKGIGESTQKYLYLPESHTDFIFPIIVEEWGLLVGIVIILLYLYLLLRILKIAREATNLGNSIIAYGVFSYIFLHIVINLIGVMGIGPLTGVPLPFLSYGGSYILTLLFSIGLVERVHYETYKKEKSLKK